MEMPTLASVSDPENGIDNEDDVADASGCSILTDVAANELVINGSRGGGQKAALVNWGKIRESGTDAAVSPSDDVGTDGR
jgi:hypothetical protein